MKQLSKMSGAVNHDYDPLEHTLKSSSPGINWAFANRGYGLPFGYSAIVWGPPKGGKSVICNSLIGNLHQTDPEAFTITFNTELRGALQQSDESLQKFGIDPLRHKTYDVNKPSEIFDRIEKDIGKMCDQGFPLKVIIIDSLSDVRGRRSLNADTVDTQQIGDHAVTIKDGLERIIPICRKHKIALLCTAHARAEMDAEEQRRKKTLKMQGAWATQHKIEYFIYVARNKWSKGAKDAAGRELVNPDLFDFRNKNMQTGHRIQFLVEGSSIGQAGRQVEFTLDYTKGIINTHEEVFQLGTNFGIIEQRGAWYYYGENKWNGIKQALDGLAENEELQKEITQLVFEADRKALVS